jgi:hypothetical protein
MASEPMEDIGMARRRHTAEEIVAKLRQVDVLTSQGWAAAAMQEATKGFRRLKACKHLPALRAALNKPTEKHTSPDHLVQIAEAA